MTEVFGTDISPSRYLDHTDHVHCGRLNVYHSLHPSQPQGGDDQLSESKTNRYVHNQEDGMRNTDSDCCKMPSIYSYCSHDKNPECSLIKGNTLHRIIHMYSVKLC